MVLNNNYLSLIIKKTEINDNSRSLIITKKAKIHKYFNDEEYKKRVQYIETTHEYIEPSLLEKLREEEKIIKFSKFYRKNEKIKLKCYCDDIKTFIKHKKINDYLFVVNPGYCKNILLMENYFKQQYLIINNNCKYVKDFGALRSLKVLELCLYYANKKKFYNLHCLKNLIKLDIDKNIHYSNKLFVNVKKQIKKLLKINSRVILIINKNEINNKYPKI